MSRSILDQNGIILLDGHEVYDEIIISPMFMWELFNNVGSNIEKALIQYLKKISDRIFITFKSTTCEAIEIHSGASSPFSEIIDHQNTQVIRHWLNDDDPSLLHIRDKLAPGFTSDMFRLKLNELAKTSWIQKLQKEFQKFYSSKDKELTRSVFDAENEEVSKDLCQKSIQACYKILKSKGFSQEKAIIFLKQPSIFYNRVFGTVAIYMYRSTQAEKTFQSKNVANDIKDVEYLFMAHYAEHLIGKDNFMKHTFSHLRKSYEILSNMETGL